MLWHGTPSALWVIRATAQARSGTRTQSALGGPRGGAAKASPRAQGHGAAPWHAGAMPRPALAEAQGTASALRAMPYLASRALGPERSPAMACGCHAKAGPRRGPGHGIRLACHAKQASAENPPRPTARSLAPRVALGAPSLLGWNLSERRHASASQRCGSARRRSGSAACSTDTAWTQGCARARRARHPQPAAPIAGPARHA